MDPMVWLLIGVGAYIGAAVIWVNGWHRGHADPFLTPEEWSAWYDTDGSRHPMCDHNAERTVARMRAREEADEYGLWDEQLPEED